VPRLCQHVSTCQRADFEPVRSAGLASALRRAIATDAAGLYIGVPCSREFPFLHRRALELIRNTSTDGDPGRARPVDGLLRTLENHGGKAASIGTPALHDVRFPRTRLTTATLFINGNFEQARRLLPTLITAWQSAALVRVHIVVSASADVARFAKCTGILPSSVRRVPPSEAYPTGLEKHADAWRAFETGDIVVLCAGPLGRLLALHWHAHQPRATYLELGSFFDPDLTPPQASFFGRRSPPRYYPQVQCGVRVEPTLYQPRVRHRACQAGPGDVKAKLDERGLMVLLRRNLQLARRERNISAPGRSLRR